VLDFELAPFWEIGMSAHLPRCQNMSAIGGNAKSRYSCQCKNRVMDNHKWCAVCRARAARNSATRRAKLRAQRAAVSG